jgi:putative DNA primase/helicase
MTREAQVALARPLEALDADPLVVNTLAGALRFRRVTAGEEGMSPVADVELVAHARAALLSKLAPVAWDPEATCPRFDDFLAEVQPDPTIRAFLARWLGVSMSGLAEQRLAFFHGAGANGKSVLMDLMGRVMGSYSTTARIETLIGRNRRSGGDATPDLIPLIGARMVRASEPEEGERLNEAVIKAMTGGEPFLVRALHADFIEVVPRFKLTLSGNHKPEIRGTDDGIWRRVMLVPWDVQIPEARRDPDLVVKLFAEAPGVLNWLVAGLIDYLEAGLRVPDQVKAATDGYREDSDPMGRFLAECCEVTGAEGVFTRTRDLVEAFSFWLTQNGSSPWKLTTIQRRLAEKAGRWRDPRTGLTFSPHKASVSGYAGLRLTDLFRTRFERDGPAEASRSGGYAAREDDL